MRVCVTGASGFVASHLCSRLKADGHWVRGIDIVEPRWGSLDVDEFVRRDLRDPINARIALAGGITWVFALAADMGGAGWVFTGEHDADIMRNNTLIGFNTLEAARRADVQRYFFSSSACIYPRHLQEDEDSVALRECDAYPADPDSAYGLEKLYMERLCLAYADAGLIDVRIARFHNITGVPCHWNDGREKLPAAACRKIAEACKNANPLVEIWGDGQAVRSFCHISDCLEMVMRLMESDYCFPMNIGTSQAVTVKGLYELAADIAGISDKIDWVHIDGPEGVRRRNADLRLMKSVLKYEPQVSLREALTELYGWVREQL